MFAHLDLPRAAARRRVTRALKAVAHVPWMMPRSRGLRPNVCLPWARRFDGLRSFLPNLSLLASREQGGQRPHRPSPYGRRGSPSLHDTPHPQQHLPADCRAIPVIHRKRDHDVAKARLVAYRNEGGPFRGGRPLVGEGLDC